MVYHGHGSDLAYSPDSLRDAILVCLLEEDMHGLQVYAVPDPIIIYLRSRLHTQYYLLNVWSFFLLYIFTCSKI